MTYLDRFERVDWPPEYRPPCPACGSPLAGLRDLPLDASGTRVAAFGQPCGCNVNDHAQRLQADAPTMTRQDMDRPGFNPVWRTTP